MIEINRDKCVTNSKRNSAIIYPGTFDPITLGHIDVITRASCLFDKIIVAVALSKRKKTLFSIEERCKLAQEALAELPNIEVLPFAGLLVDFAREQNIFVILRGLRAISDFEHEFQLVGLYQQFEPRIETVFMMPAVKYLHISSSMAREIAELQGSKKELECLVPPKVCAALETKLSH